MKRFLFVLLSFVILGSAFQSCKDEENTLTPAWILVQWAPSEYNVLFPSGCRIDEGEIEYDGLISNLGSCDAVIYSYESVTHMYPANMDLMCRISEGESVFDIKIHDALAYVDGPIGEGYEETYVYFRGGFLATLGSYIGDDFVPATIAEVYHDGVEYPVYSIKVSGYWINNREFRTKYDGLPRFEEITKHLEYTDCDINIELNVEGKPLILHITHISPL